MTGQGVTHAAMMDGVYRYQRHVYDATRKYYLLGRDRLVEGLSLAAGQSVLEIGCGTGRNLALVGRRYPGCRLFGIDISQEMLKNARRTLRRHGLESRAKLARADAMLFPHANPFGEERFDRIFISYSLSMIPGWREVLDNAARALAPGGALHVVDFGLQSGLPLWFGRALRAWLARFHVEPRPDLEDVMRAVAERGGASLDFRSLHLGYASLGVIRMASADAASAASPVPQSGTSEAPTSLS